LGTAGKWTAGRSQRAIANRCAGTDLSLPEISTIPSCGWPSAWISIIAAMMSREFSE
jgi:hypothetical protein